MSQRRGHGATAGFCMKAMERIDDEDEDEDEDEDQGEDDGKVKDGLHRRPLYFETDPFAATHMKQQGGLNQTHI